MVSAGLGGLEEGPENWRGASVISPPHQKQNCVIIMSTILTTPATTSLDHFRNPWIAPAWVFLVALAVAVITVLTAWGLRLVRNRYRAPKVVVVEKKRTITNHSFL